MIGYSGLPRALGKCFNRAMKIQKILEQHQKFSSPEELSQNLGDGYLLAKNKIFNKVRSQALGFGFQYDKTPNEAYWALPLSQLEAVISTKKIPYIDNVSVLIQIEKLIPQTSQWDDVTDNLKRNHVFHESCHAVARQISKKYFKESSERDKKILQLMIEESFANACELLGIVDVEDTFHKLFYEINSYIFMFDDKSNLKNFMNDLGKKEAFKFLIFTYLHANYIHPRYEDKTLDKVVTTLFKDSAKSIKADVKKMKTFRAISRVCFELNPRFRMVTSIFYLKLIGFSVSLDEMSKIDFMNQINQNPVYLKFIDELVDQVI